MIKILEKVLEPDIIELNDKYFPRVDLSDSRYKKYKYKGHMFAYDTKYNIVLKLFKDDAELEILGNDTPWRELDTIGLSFDNWKDKVERNSYLDEWIQSTSDYLVQDFIDSELPYYQNESVEPDNISNYKVKIFLPYYEDDEDMCYVSTTVEASSEDEARKLGQKYIKSKKTSMNSKAWKDARIDNIEKIHDKAINEGTSYKRIARYGEFDNGKPYIKANESYSIEQLADGETISDYVKDIKAYNLKISKLSGNKVKISGKKSDIIRYYDEVLGIEPNSIGIRKQKV